ncbi:MAG: hypothetical protein WCT27_05575, partial [Patescibacteria group bacterium]
PENDPWEGQNYERAPKREVENYSSRVLLHLERHGDKAGELLSEGGKKQLFEKGKSRGKAERTAVAIGSQIERAQHSAALDMAGAEGTPDVDGTESPEELRQKLDAAKGRKFGSRVGTDPRLGFSVGGPEYKTPIVKAFGEKQGLKFLVEDSDKLAKLVDEKEGLTYANAAGSVAGVLEKYTKVAGNFDKIISDDSKREEYGKVLERFLGSHAGVVDAFLTKLVERIKGPAERDKLVEILGHGAGFDTGEGFDVEIDNLPGQSEPQVRVKYSKQDKEGKDLFEFDEIIPQDLLKQLVEEGKPAKE